MTKLTLATIALGSLLLLVLGSSLASSGERPEPTWPDPVVKTEAEWKEALTDAEYRILREAGTERPFTSDLLHDKGEGVYTCAACGLELYPQKTKFDSGTGWPSFYAPVDDDRVILTKDASLGMVRTEVSCARCGGHLGHVFEDGPEPTGLRHCINGDALDKVGAEAANDESAVTLKKAAVGPTSDEGDEPADDATK